ncbi:MAG: hypothetical protein RH862_15860 [Leptospiraceae bacterium]
MKEPIEESDIAYAGFYNYDIYLDGSFFRLYSTGNDQFVRKFPEDHVSRLPVQRRIPVETEKVARLVLASGLRPAMSPQAIARLDLKSARGVYQAIQTLKSGSYEDFALLFEYDGQEDQLYLNDFGRPFLAVGRHQPTFRKVSFGWGFSGLMTGYISILTLGLVPAVWKEPAETFIIVYDRNLDVVASTRYEHGTYALSAVWVDSEEGFVMPPGGGNPHAGGIHERSAQGMYDFMNSEGSGLFSK